MPFSVALFLNAPVSYSTRCFAACLKDLGFQVNWVTVRQDFSSDLPTTQLRSIEDLNVYDICLYQYDTSFPLVSSWFESFHGVVIIRYQETGSLAALRASSYAGTQILALENLRQYFTEWVQKHANAVFWLPDSPSAAKDLLRWGANNNPQHLAICPDFSDYTLGAYADITEKPYRSRVNFLVLTDFKPDFPYMLYIKALQRYQLEISDRVSLTFMGAFDPVFTPYKEQLVHTISVLGLDDFIHLNALESGCFLIDPLSTDLLLLDSHTDPFCAERIQAYAIGLPVVFLSSDEVYSGTAAKAMHDAVFDKCYRASLVLKGYREFYKNFSDASVSQSFLNGLFMALHR